MSLVNSIITLNTVLAVNLSEDPVYLKTVLNKMIDTASLVIPSPKTIENSLGSFWKSIKDTAATTSDEHIKEHNNKISLMVNSNFSVIPVSGIYFSIGWK